MSRWSAFGLIACGRQSRTRTQGRKRNLTVTFQCQGRNVSSSSVFWGCKFYARCTKVFQMGVNMLAQFTTLLQCTPTATEKLSKISSPNIIDLIRMIMPRGWDGQRIWNLKERDH
jgi:hypothetical protein